jgi:uncharacterized phiE125 gp8 family phage protein
MTLETLIAPVGEPVTLAAARAFLRIGSDGDDGVLTSLITACREAFEARTGRALVTRTLRQRFMVSERFQQTLPGALLPGRAGAKTLVATRIIASDGTEAIAPTGLTTLVDGRFMLNRPLPAGALGVSLDYEAGFGPPAAVPEAYKLAILDALNEALVRRDEGKSGPESGWESALSEVKL